MSDDVHPLAKWPFRRMFVLTFSLVMGSIMLKAVLYAAVAATFDLEVMPLRWVILFAIPVAALAALFLTRWIRRLVFDEEARPQW